MPPCSHAGVFAATGTRPPASRPESGRRLVGERGEGEVGCDEPRAFFLAARSVSAARSFSPLHGGSSALLGPANLPRIGFVSQAPTTHGRPRRRSAVQRCPSGAWGGITLVTNPFPGNAKYFWSSLLTSSDLSHA